MQGVAETPPERVLNDSSVPYRALVRTTHTFSPTEYLRMERKCCSVLDHPATFSAMWWDAIDTNSRRFISTARVGRIGAQGK